MGSDIYDEETKIAVWYMRGNRLLYIGAIVCGYIGSYDHDTNTNNPVLR